MLITIIVMAAILMLGTIAEKEIATKKLYGKMFIACVIAVSVLEVAKLL